MSINDIVRAWKGDDEDDKDGEGEKAPENPAGQELSDEELEQAAGGLGCPITNTCTQGNPSCGTESYG